MFLKLPTHVLAASVLAASLLAGSASAGTNSGADYRSGTVIDSTGCQDRFVVTTDDGYSILSWVGGAPVQELDYVIGNVQRIGRTELQNETRHQKLVGIVEYSRLSDEDYRLTRQRICR